MDGLRSHLLHSELSPKTLEIGLLAPTTLEIGLGVDVIEMALIENEWVSDLLATWGSCGVNNNDSYCTAYASCGLRGVAGKSVC